MFDLNINKWICMSCCLLLLSGLPACSNSEPKEDVDSADPLVLPLLATYDFESGEVTDWEPSIADNWKVVTEGGSMVYALLAPGEQGSVRAPTSRSVLTDFDVTSFELTGRFKSNADVSIIRRDLCIFFHYQDPLNFYYVHFSGASDAVHNIIALVNNKDREKINLEPEGSSAARLTDLSWHHFKVSVSMPEGRIEAFLDDMMTPVMTAVDTTLSHGAIGLGSFDDTGFFDDIELRGISHQN
jgi:hypothetical protein